MNPTVKRILHIIGIASAVGVAVLLPIVDQLPAESTWAIRLGMLASILATLRGAFGSNVTSSGSDAANKPKGPGATAVILVLGSLFLGGLAMAQTPESQFGGCVADGNVCFGPSATVTVGEFNLATQKFSGGIIPGLGYGATVAPAQWYATGLAMYLSFDVGQTGPNEAIPSVMVSFANYLRIGTGVSITEHDGGVQTQWHLLFGIGSDFGGSPKYLGQDRR
jgi:hypothetical protein